MFGKKKKKKVVNNGSGKVEDKKIPLSYKPGTHSNAEYVVIKLLEAQNQNLMSIVHLLSQLVNKKEK